MSKTFAQQKEEALRRIFILTDIYQKNKTETDYQNDHNFLSLKENEQNFLLKKVKESVEKQKNLDHYLNSQYQLLKDLDKSIEEEGKRKELLKKEEERKERIRTDKENFLKFFESVRQNEAFSDYKSVFTKARKIKREFVAYLGPTNSGKTYNAMEDLIKSNKGVYLSPLRLMALENFEKMKDRKVLGAGLITGEEQIMPDGELTHLAQTIETLNFDEEYDVAIIDEIQMISDQARGSAWLNAVLGVAAKKVYLCGASLSESLVKELVALTGEEITIIKTERKSPLEISSVIENQSVLPEKGTGFVCFSRKNVLNWKYMLETAGKKVAVVYGALSPEVRKEQSRKFRDGEVDYIVATDAIGMGLNLPIKKIIFTETTKYDGKEHRELTTQEVKQIGGRAGRYGVVNEVGVISSFSKKDLLLLKRNYHAIDDDISMKDICLKPSFLHIQQICQKVNNYSLSYAFNIFEKIGHDTFTINLIDEDKDKVIKLDSVFGNEPQALKDKWLFYLTPVDEKNESIVMQFYSWAKEYAESLTKKRTKILFKLPKECYGLEEYENNRKLVTVYLWLALKKPEVFVDFQRAKDYGVIYDEKINELLVSKVSKSKKNSKLGLSFCHSCGNLMPLTSSYKLCYDCFQFSKNGY